MFFSLDKAGNSGSGHSTEERKGSVLGDTGQAQKDKYCARSHLHEVLGVVRATGTESRMVVPGPGKGGWVLVPNRDRVSTWEIWSWAVLMVVQA